MAVSVVLSKSSSHNFHTAAAAATSALAAALPPTPPPFSRAEGDAVQLGIQRLYLDALHRLRQSHLPHFALFFLPLLLDALGTAAIALVRRGFPLWFGEARRARSTDQAMLREIDRVLDVAGTTGAAAAAVVAVPMGALEVIAPTDKIIADFHRAIQRALKPLTADRNALRHCVAQSHRAAAHAQAQLGEAKTELDSVRGILEAERATATQQTELLAASELQVQSLQAAALAATPQAAQLDHARATIAERDAELAQLRQSAEADLANARSDMQDSSAALQREVDELREELDEFRRISVVMANLATPKRARDSPHGDDQGDEQTRSRPRHAPDSA